MGFVDCDSHLIETEHTWDFLRPDEEVYRPRIANFSETMISLGTKTEAGRQAPPGRMWVVGDTWSSKLRGDSNMWSNANLYDPVATEFADPEARIKDLDALGIDLQLVISSFFIGVEIENPLAEAALTRSFNRWAASVVNARPERFRWTLRPPLRLLNRAIEELEFGAANGAAGIHLRGIEHGYFLSDPYFYPLYERAEELNLAIIVHVGAAHRRVNNLPIGRVIASPPAFMGHVHQIMAGFHAVISSDMHKRFPRLRWGFVEGGATWVPAVLQQHSRLVASGSSEFLDLRPVSSEELEAKNIFVACEVDEDLPYLIKHVGENVLCAGTDYGHNDVGSELAAHVVIRNRADLTPEQARKIVDDNGRKLLGVPLDTSRRYISDVPDALPHVSGAVTDSGAPILTSPRRPVTAGPAR
jgi:predicted TIM-barrel fold metal-dependent hydrolase